MDDIYSLLMADEPTAQEQAQAMAQALRRQRAGGNLALLTGDKVLGRFGAAQLEGAGQQEGMLAHAGQQRAGGVLQRTLQASSQGFQAEQGKAEREARSREGGLNRALEREMAGGRLSLEAMKAQREAAEAEARRNEGRVKAGGELRKELQGLQPVKDFQNISVAYDKIQRAAKQPSAAGDLAMIFSTMKLLDPGSTVREGEFANAQNAAGIPDRVVAQYNKILSGERLGETQRADFLNLARNLYGTHEAQYKKLASQYRGLAEQAGADPTQVVLDLSAEGGTAAGAGAAPRALSPEDQAALGWAKANPADPRAQAILQAHGGAQ